MYKTRENRRQDLLHFLNNEMPGIRERLSQGEPYDFLQSVEQLEEKRAAFISQYRRIPLGCESFFVVLRKWNSYTPSLPIESDQIKRINQYSIGGGYFLYVQGQENSLKSGYGLVIDPGYNFIHNFGLAGFCLDDIDGIFITHAHNDHTNDFESLLSLLYQRNDKYLNHRTSKKVDLFLNVGSFKKFSNYLDLANTDFKNYIGKVTVMSPGQSIRVPGRDDLDFEILTIYTKHHEIITADYSLGACFRVSGRNLLLTGDTGWDFDIADLNEAFLREHSVHTRVENATDAVDVLVAHIGTIKRSEFANEEITKKEYYKKHLGILGTISTIENWKPDLCIVSEFGEELNDIRGPLVAAIQSTAQKIHPSIKCLPGDIGLFVLLDSRKCMCYFSGEPVEWDQISYSDVEEGESQRTIKYYSEDRMPPHAPKDEILRTLPIRDGLGIYKKVFYESVKSGFHLGPATRNTLIRDVAAATFDLNPWDQEEKELYINGRLIALSCIIDNPNDILEVVASGRNLGLIADFLKYYMMNTQYKDVDIFTSFATFCGMRGFDEPDESKSAEDVIIYQKSGGLLHDIAVAFRTYDIEKASQILDSLRNVTVASVWSSLSHDERIDVLLANGGAVKDVVLSTNEATIGSYIKQYQKAISDMRTVVDGLIRQCSDEERCWQAATGISTAMMREELPHVTDLDKRIYLEEAIRKSAELDDLFESVQTLSNGYIAYLLSTGLAIQTTSNAESNLFRSLFNLIARNEPKDIEERNKWEEILARLSHPL